MRGADDACSTRHDTVSDWLVVRAAAAEQATLRTVKTPNVQAVLWSF